MLTVFLTTVMDSGLVMAHEHEHHPGMDMSGHWMAPERAAKQPNPVSANPASQARGAALFQTHCASCHGSHGEGDGAAGTGLEPKPANLKAMSTHHSDGDLAWKIAHGRGAMPAWKGILKPKQIWDVVNYLRQLGAP